jgi:transitional endoplasmic reticulum ATPase
MLEDGTFKEILEDRYQQNRSKADTLREHGEHEEAAKYYRKCADVMADIAEKEPSDRMAQKRRDLAENLATAADKLESAGERDEEPARDGDPAAGDGTGGSSGPGPGGAAGAGGGGSGEEDGVDAEQYLSEVPEKSFGDVGGMSELKQTLQDKVIDPLERSDLYERYDVGVVNGIMLFGPPGTGKTYITEALAGELGYNFIDIKTDQLTSSLVGEAAKNVGELFEVARNNQPCMVFIDEIDAVAGQRSGGSQKTSSEEQMVTQFLQELTEINDRNEDIIVVAATNLLEDVDDAIRRSGRFDERIEVPPPDATARKAILRIHLREKPVLTDTIDWDEVARKTEGFVASDMELLATEAAYEAIDDVGEGEDIQPITQAHLDRAIESVEPSGPAA